MIDGASLLAPLLVDSVALGRKEAFGNGQARRLHSDSILSILAIENPMAEPNSRVQSMGWLTESTVMPKKQKVIQGVGPSSVVELKAELYKAQVSKSAF